MTGYKDKSVWIIGASSGIGAALARELGKRGAKLILSARREKELNDLAAEIGGGAVAMPLDVADAGAVKAAAEKIGHIDSAIFMAGAYDPGAIADMKLASAATIIDVNIKGALNMIAAVLPSFRARKGGQIALCGSVAGYRGLPNAQPYGLTKAAIINLAESLRAEEAANGVDVRVINPGFVKTPMTDMNAFPMPMIITAEEAAISLADGLAGKAFEIHFPKKFTYIMKTLRILPSCLYFWAARGMK